MSKKDQNAATSEYLLRFGAQYSAHKTDRLGKFGPASPVRWINPKTGEVIEVVEARTPGTTACILSVGAVPLPHPVRTDEYNDCMLTSGNPEYCQNAYRD
jgi:hypothetical protein